MRVTPAAELEQALRWLLATRRPDLSIEQAVRVLCRVLTPDHTTLQTLQRIAQEEEAKASSRGFNWRTPPGLPPRGWPASR